MKTALLLLISLGMLASFGCKEKQPDPTAGIESAKKGGPTEAELADMPPEVAAQVKARVEAEYAKARQTEQQVLQQNEYQQKLRGKK